MVTFLLVIIYMTFISLGLPDTLGGVAWPAVYPDLALPLSYGGILSVVGSAGSILSSFLSGRLVRRFGTGPLVTFSVALTAVALVFYSMAQSFWMLCLLSIPLGLGGGAVDAALNAFIALHYKARHMNWLHSFWGIGATVGPLIMSVALVRSGWRQGYLIVGLLQTGLVAILLATQFLWKRVDKKEEETAGETSKKPLTTRQLIALPFAKGTLALFSCYCVVETTAGAWGATFLVVGKGVSVELAAVWVSLFYGGITAGRMLAGFLSFKLNNKNMIRVGLAILGLGILLLLVSPINELLMVGFLLIGLGCAPIFPAVLHDTPYRFGKENAQALIGIQMAIAYAGGTIASPVFGLIAGQLSPLWFAPYMLVFWGIMVLAGERVNRGLARRDHKTQESL